MPRRSFWRRVRNLFLWVLALAVVALAALLWWSPAPPKPEPPAPPPVIKRAGPPLQADAEGTYVPSYHFAVNDRRFAGFSLHPDTVVIFERAGVGTKESLGCENAVIKADVFHLRCDGPQGSHVTIDGKFVKRLATTRSDIPVASAAITVRSGSGEVLYNARDRFEWQP